MTARIDEPGMIILPQLVAELERRLVEAGADLPDLLAGLRAERQRLYDERWRPFVEGVDQPDR